MRIQNDRGEHNVRLEEKCKGGKVYDVYLGMGIQSQST